MSVLAASSAYTATEDSVSYIGEDGTFNTQNNVTVIDSTYFAVSPYVLDDLGADSGWYLVRGTFALGSVITITGNVSLILEDNCHMTASGPAGKAGINVTGADSLTIYAQSTGGTMGTMIANGGNGGAGIGGNMNSPGGAITIRGGNVTANGGNSGAGIGGAGGGAGGTITISGGNVTANSGGTGDGAGIGGGGTGGAGGTITISGGNVTAKGTGGGAGIGGSVGADCGLIAISGGTVTATGGAQTVGIGGGSMGFTSAISGIVVISGGTVTATGGSMGAGIGGGYHSSGGTTFIFGTDTKVTATGGASSARDIGGGGLLSADYELLAMLPYGNLLGRNGLPIGNAVLFTADPHTTIGTVTAALPSPYNIYGPSGDGRIPLVTGLGPDLMATPSAKEVSFLTTLMTQTIVFSLDGYSDSPQSRTGTQLASAGGSVDFHNRSYFEVTVDITGNGSVDVSDGTITYGTVTVLTSGETFTIPGGGEIFLTAAAGVGYAFEGFIINGTAAGNPTGVLMDSDKFVTAVFVVPPTPPASTTCFIIASSDSGSTIAPEGKVSVPRLGSRTFVFSANEGRTISAVTVDGVHLTQAQIASGSYTFYDVRANHVISVVSRELRKDITLRIDVVEGRGYAEYSVNGGVFIRYAGVVILPEFCSVDVRAFADDGYRFSKWMEGDRAYKTEMVPFDGVGAAFQLELYFIDDSGIPWWVFLLVALLILLVSLMWFLFFRRRYVEVRLLGSLEVDGADRVHRKSPYRFSMRDGHTGAVSYRIGEKGEWKQVFPDAKGEYLIPRGETIDDIYLEKHL
ncbi:MAG: hypothetical protein LBB30_03025 [Candidatus Methanoplasma sp.]|nr:hypothetical protein [Candidatus Methanoplasma sp.]